MIKIIITCIGCLILSGCMGNEIFNSIIDNAIYGNPDKNIKKDNRMLDDLSKENMYNNSPTFEKRDKDIQDRQTELRTDIKKQEERQKEARLVIG